jgi:hypothetical protein
MGFFSDIGISLNPFDQPGVPSVSALGTTEGVLTGGLIPASTLEAAGIIGEDAGTNVTAGQQGPQFQSIDELIAARTPEAIGLIEEGTTEALRLSEEAQRAARDPLQRFADLAAFEEQSRILGLSGEEAQREAIAGIPVSEFTRELNRRQRAGQIRRAVAGGDVSGASLLAQSQLGAQQQADIIQNRLAQLEPLAATARAARTTQSQIDEASRARQAQLLSGRGSQIANIRLGVAAPIISSLQQRAELSGLRGIASAQQQANVANQLAQAAGQLAPQIANLFQPAATSAPSVAATPGAVSPAFQGSFTPTGPVSPQGTPTSFGF